MNRQVFALLVSLLAALVLATACGGGTAKKPTVGRIAFVSNGDGNDEIYTVNADGTGLTNLTNNPAGDTYPTWSPDGKRIVFTSDRDSAASEKSLIGDPMSQIYVMNADGSDVTRLTYRGGANLFPRWSPDGKRVAFSSIYSGSDGIYVMNQDGSDLTLVTKARGVTVADNWSPDSNRLSFTVEPGNLYTMGADGSGVIALTGSGKVTRDRAAEWSPDGRRILFGEAGDVHVVNADGTGLTNLTNDPAGDRDPSWSPDGKRVAFTSDRDGFGQIYVMNADGSDVARVAQDTATAGGATWSPDGAKIAFVSDLVERAGDLNLMNSDGSEQMRLTTTAEIGIVWSPVRYEAGTSAPGTSPTARRKPPTPPTPTATPDPEVVRYVNQLTNISTLRDVDVRKVVLGLPLDTAGAATIRMFTQLTPLVDAIEPPACAVDFHRRLRAAAFSWDEANGEFATALEQHDATSAATAQSKQLQAVSTLYSTLGSNLPSLVQHLCEGPKSSTVPLEDEARARSMLDQVARPRRTLGETIA